MKYRKLGKTGFEVSAVTYGGIVFSTTLDDRSMEPYEQSGSDRQVAWAFDHGINYHHFSFAVNHLDEMIENPITKEERTLLQKHLEKVREYPFFDKSCYTI